MKDDGERLVYVAGEPCRLMNTRPGDNQVGPRITPLPEGTPVSVDARGAAGNCTAEQLPDDATALQLNVTPVNATDPTDITIWPEGPIPQASSVNPRPGPPVPNAVLATLASDGTFLMQNKVGTIDMVIDVLGYYVDHTHDDRYARLDDRMRMEFATGLSAFGGSIADVNEPSTVDDLATATIEAPADGGARLVVATATIHVNTSGDQGSTWSLDVAANGGVQASLGTRTAYVVSGTSSINPADTITLSRSVVQQPGDSHEFSISGVREAGGVPLANIRVDLQVVSSPLDGSGEVPS